MKVPKSIIIFGKTIKIIRKNLGPNYLGMYYPGKDLIALNCELEKSEISLVLIHEIMHAIFDRCSINQVVSYPNEEMIVDMVTKCLVEMFDMKFKK